MGCETKSSKPAITPFIFPEEVHTIYHINDKDHFLSAIANNSFWKAHTPQSLRLHEVKLLNSIPIENDLWVAFSGEGHFTVVAHRAEKDTISFWRNASAQIQKQAQFGKEWYYTVVGQYLVIGDSPDIEAYHSLKGKPLSANQEVLQRLQQASSSACIGNLFLQKTVANGYFESLFSTEVLPNIKPWVAFDLFLEENNVRLSGIALIDQKEADVMTQTQPYQNNTLALLPARSLDVMAYTFDDADKLSPNDSLSQEPPFKTSINGVAFVKTLDGQIAVASSFDVDETIQQLPVLLEDFQYNFPLYELNPEVPLHFFTTFIKDFIPRYAGVYEKQIVFAKSKDLVLSAINDMQRGNVLSANKSFHLLEENSASNVTLTRIANLYDQASVSSKHPMIAEQYRWALFQVTPQNDFYVLNFVSERQTENSVSDEMRERFRLTVDDRIVTPPTLLLNHRTKRLEIAVQDASNDLYLIGNNGSLLWKKHLDGKIQSPIYQVDLFKNGFLQMAFSTEKSIWVIDRNGNEVAPFPIKYKDEITPLEVFDYEGNREYRFLVATNNMLHLLDRKGTPVKGFFQRTNGKPLFTPKHYRFNDKDYLVYPTDNGIFNIMHRNGEVRIMVKDRYAFSNNPPVLWNNQFMFTTQEGYAIAIDEKGGIRKEKKQLADDFYWGGNKHILVALSGNVLSIGAKKVNLLEGKYTRPKQFRIRGVNYVSVTDTQTQKAFLYDEKGNLVKDFPVESISVIDIDVDSDKSIWIATEKSPTEVILYTMKQFN